MSGENRRRRKKPRSVVLIKGYNALNQLVLEETLSWDEYYEETGHIIDDTDRIRELGIVRIKGELFDSDGVLAQEFETKYDGQGKYIGGTSRFADGTVTHDP